MVLAGQLVEICWPPCCCLRICLDEWTIKKVPLVKFNRTTQLTRWHCHFFQIHTSDTNFKSKFQECPKIHKIKILIVVKRTYTLPVHINTLEWKSHNEKDACIWFSLFHSISFGFTEVVSSSMCKLLHFLWILSMFVRRKIIFNAISYFNWDLKTEWNLSIFSMMINESETSRSEQKYIFKWAPLNDICIVLYQLRIELLKIAWRILLRLLQSETCYVSF